MLEEKNAAHVSREVIGSQKHGKAVFDGKLVLPVQKEHFAVKPCNSFQVKKISFGDCVVWILQLKTLDGDLYSRTYRQTKAALMSDGRQAAAIGFLEARRALRECVRQADAENSTKTIEDKLGTRWLNNLHRLTWQVDAGNNAKNNAEILEVESAVRWPGSPFRFTGVN